MAQRLEQDSRQLMTEELSDPHSSPAPPRRRRRARGALVLIVVLLVLAGAAGAGGWYGWQWYQVQEQARAARQQALAQGLAGTRGDVAALAQRLTRAEAEKQAAQDKVQALQTHVEALQQRLDALSQMLEGGRRGVQIALVEQLLLTANEAVQVGRAPQAAERALAAADERLAALHDPRFFGVRQAIADERDALAAVRLPDVAGTAIAIGKLLDGVAQLPLRGTPKPLHTPPPGVADGSGQTAWSRGWARVVAGLGALFLVQHRDHGIAPLLPPAEQRLVGAVLALRLDTARAALVQRNAAVYRSALESAGDWLTRYYQPQAPGVQAMAQRLHDLAGVDVAPALPDLSASLVLLRKQQDAE